LTYQRDVAAWLATYLLAEAHAPTLAPLPANVRVLTVAGETTDVIDDVVARASDNSTIFVQAKRAVRSLDDRDGSDFVNFVRQAVDQHLALRSGPSGSSAWYVLATSPDASAALRRDLGTVLDELREAPRTKPLDEIGHNQTQKQALSKTTSLVRRLWPQAAGEPSDSEVRALLSRIVVWVLALDGSERAGAITLLKLAVVQDPADGPRAWTELGRRAEALFVNHEVLDIAGWRNVLARAGIQLRDVPSFGSDLTRLKAISEGHAHDLADHRVLRVGDRRLAVLRSVTEEARARLDDGPLLLVGEPGSGKTGVLAQLAQQLTSEGRDVVVLAPHTLAARSLLELQRELGLDHPVGEVLRAWAGHAGAYLLIDGLDDTRGSPAVGALRQLAAEVARAAGRWTPVVSVRRFDLRYSKDLREIFAAAHDARSLYRDDEFAGVRHLAIADFNDDELRQVEDDVPSLVAIARHPIAGLLFRRPVHLQLAAFLIERGVPEADVVTLQTQVELLDLYWSRMVEIPPSRRHEREEVLSAAATEMVLQRQMVVARRVLDLVHSTSTVDLLAEGILVEGAPAPGAPRSIRFLHPLVADYAVSRLILAAAPNGIGPVLATDPTHALFLRPAIELRFSALWASSTDREAFWREAVDVAGNPAIPEIGRLIGPSVAAATWRSLSDLEPLIARFPSRQREAALVCLRHLVGAATVPGGPVVAGAGAAPWDELAARLAGSITPDLSYVTRLLVMLLTEEPMALTAGQIGNAGAAARALLDFAWHIAPRDAWLVRWALRGVCRTFPSDPASSSEQLCRALRRRHVAAYGHEELQWLADELASLRAAPEVVVGLYTAAFRFEDSSNETTWLSHSPVLPMTSSRRQDFEMSRYILGERFPSVLAADAVTATVVLLRVIRGYSKRRRHWGRAAPVVRATVDGQRTRFREDDSGDWLSGVWSSDEEIQMSVVWIDYLKSQVVDSQDAVEDLLALFLRSNRIVFGWRLLTRAAAESEALAPPVVRLLATATRLLEMPALHADLCRLAAALRDERSRLLLREALSSAALEPAVRARLLGCLEGATSEGSTPPRDLDTEALAEELFGRANAEASPERSSDEAELTAWLDREPDATISDIPAVADRLHRIADSLGTHDDSTESTWFLLSRAAGRLAAERQDCTDPAGRTAAQILTRVVDIHDEPGQGAAERNDAIRTIPTHGCVLEAVKGLVLLHAGGGCTEIVSSKSLLSLAMHPLPWAREQLARSAPLLFASDPDLMWRLLERLVDDPEATVAADAVAIATHVRAGAPDRARTVLSGALRHKGLGKVEALGEHVLALVGHLAIDGSIPVDAFKEVLLTHRLLPMARELLRTLRGLLTSGSETGEGSPSDERRVRAFQLVSITQTAAIDRYQELGSQPEQLGDAKRQELIAVVDVLASIAMELYFASGAYRPSNQEPRIPPARMVRFFDESTPLLKDLAAVGPGRATHHIVEIAAANSTERPREAFLLVATAVRAARRLGYETDSLAKDLVLGMVRGYLSDRRELFHGTATEAQEARVALIDILDSFVAAGWPEARGLSYHLHEVFR
jgi:hypothetical protein